MWTERILDVYRRRLLRLCRVCIIAYHRILHNVLGCTGYIARDEDGDGYGELFEAISTVSIAGNILDDENSKINILDSTAHTLYEASRVFLGTGGQLAGIPGY